MIDATADKQGLTISTTGAVRLRLHAKDLMQTKISATTWELPGLNVAVSSDAKNFSMEKAEDSVDVVYSGMTGMKLEIKTTQ